MASANPEERLLAAHSDVSQACDLLITASPEALESSQAWLQRAVSELAGLQPHERENADAGSNALRLRTELLRADRLLQSLSGFYQGWERILGAMSAGYTATGDAAPVLRHGRLCCRG